MSLDDRDWYRDLKREQQGLKPKWSLWRGKSSSAVDVRHNPYYVKPSRQWHPVLTVLLTFFICAGVYAILKFIHRFSTL